MIVELIGVGLVVSAFLAVYLDEAIYSVASLAMTLVLTAILYSVNDSGFAAVFQFVISIGTLAVLFLSAETLTEKLDGGRNLRKTFLGLAAGLVLSIPSLAVSLEVISTKIHPETPFSEALWGLRGIDVALQGLVILTVASGIVIILGEKRRNNRD
jgi:NADH:ubiquinone oxidoreductase subunit 6 (subunit J)